jgi:acid stress-induced BolA-like protein IbaG/YrbA
MHPDQIKQLIEAGLPAAEAAVASDDGTHFEAVIVSPEFRGKPTLARHQMVYACLGERMGREIHALSMRTLTPEEVTAAGGD